MNTDSPITSRLFTPIKRKEFSRICKCIRDTLAYTHVHTKFLHLTYTHLHPAIQHPHTHHFQTRDPKLRLNFCLVSYSSFRHATRHTGKFTGILRKPQFLFVNSWPLLSFPFFSFAVLLCTLVYSISVPLLPLTFFFSPESRPYVNSSAT